MYAIELVHSRYIHTHYKHCDLQKTKYTSQSKRFRLLFLVFWYVAVIIAETCIKAPEQYEER